MIISYSVGILVFGGDHYRNLSHIVDPIGYEIMHLVNYPVETAESDFWGSCAGELNNLRVIIIRKFILSDLS